MPHEPVYLNEEQIEAIADLRLSIVEIEESNMPASAIAGGIAAIEEEIGEIEAEAPAGLPKTPCPTCNPLTHCPTCRNPIGDDGHTAIDGIAYLPEEVSDAE